MKFSLRHGDDHLILEVTEEAGGYRVSDGKRSWHVRLDDARDAIRTATVDTGPHRIGVWRKGETWDVVLDGINYEFLTRDARFERLLELGGGASKSTGRAEMRAPIPGLVTAVLVQAGEDVAEGEPVLVLAAMKLENEIRAPRAGRIAEVSVASGAAVEKGQLLAVIEPSE